MNFKADPQEELAIRLKIETYIDGFLKLDSALLRQAFDADTNLVAISEGKIETTPTASWFSRVEQRKATGVVQPPAEVKIVGIDQHGDAAIARVELNFPEYRFTDYLSLLKTASGWKIANKIYTMA